MTPKHITSGALIGLILTTGIVGTVSAQSLADATGLSPEQAAELAVIEVAAPEQLLSEEDAIAIALAEIQGDVTETEFEREDGMHLFEIEIDTPDDGEVEVVINASTGEILDIERDDDHRDCDKAA